MTDKEIKKLSRLQLLELLLEQSKENEQLRQDNEAYRQRQESTQAQPEASVSFDPTVLAGFSEFAQKIDSSLSETRRATQSYIERLSVLAEFAEKSVTGTSAVPPARKTGPAAIAVTDENVSEVEQIPVKPLKKAKPVKKLEIATDKGETADISGDTSNAADGETVSTVSPAYVPAGTYPIMGAPVYQPVPVYYPVPAPVASVPVQAKSSAERRSENGITVRQLSKKKKEEQSSAMNEDTQLVAEIVKFCFENPKLLEILPEDIRKKIITRFKR